MKYWLVVLGLLLLASCNGNRGPSAGDDKAASLFIGNLRYLAAECGRVPEGNECDWRTEYIAEVCAIAETGGGEFKEINDCHLSDYFAPFCERLEIIAAESRSAQGPHLIELAQDIEESID